MRKDQKINLLIDHCRRQPAGYQDLLDALRKEYANSNHSYQELIPVIEFLEASL